MPGNLHAKKCYARYRGVPGTYVRTVTLTLRAVRQERTEVTVGVSASSCTEPEQQTQNSLTPSNHWAVRGLEGARGVATAARHCSLFTAVSQLQRRKTRSWHSQRFMCNLFSVQFWQTETLIKAAPVPRRAAPKESG
jgi:hypothetical protein